MGRKVTIPACGDCAARHCSIFNDLNARELEKITQNKGGNLYQKGQNIFFEGTYPSGLFCIHSGKVKVYKIDSTGKEQIVRLAKTGDIVGYRSLISGESYSSFASPWEDSLICFIPKEVFFQLLHTNSNLAIKVMKQLSYDLKTAEQHVANMAQKPVRERMAEALLILKEYYGVENDGKTLSISMTREDLANLVGTATESVIRFLSEFKRQQLIELSGRNIKILNKAALARIADIYD